MTSFQSLKIVLSAFVSSMRAHRAVKPHVHRIKLTRSIPGWREIYVCKCGAVRYRERGYNSEWATGPWIHPVPKQKICSGNLPVYGRLKT